MIENDFAHALLFGVSAFFRETYCRDTPFKMASNSNAHVKNSLSTDNLMNEILANKDAGNEYFSESGSENESSDEPRRNCSLRVDEVEKQLKCPVASYNNKGKIYR